MDIPSVPENVTREQIRQAIVAAVYASQGRLTPTDTTLLISVLLDGRYRLVGDEDCGVALHCRDCPDGGRPLGYYRPYPSAPPYPDVQTVSVDTIPGLLAVAADHETHTHQGT